MAAPATAQTSQTLQTAETMDHTAHMQHSQAPGMREPGQGAFAAIAEIVAALEADPTTDWSKVNIAGLREHLRDMDMVMIDSHATAAAVAGGMQFTITGTPDTAASIRRMVLAHAKVMQGVDEWTYQATSISDGATLIVTVPNGDLARLKGLGFYGMLTSGMHHQAHHWMMAIGENPHE